MSMRPDAVNTNMDRNGGSNRLCRFRGKCPVVMVEPIGAAEFKRDPFRASCHQHTMPTIGSINGIVANPRMRLPTV